MYKRDLAVLVLSAFAVYFALQNEGNFSFRKAWYSSLKLDQQFLDVPKLPDALVVDLNGDGNLEIVVATHDFKVQVLRPRGVGREGDGFAAAEIMSEVSLLPDKGARIPKKHPVAIAAGFIDPPSVELVRKPRKAVLVVVTADWHVVCLDHNLNMMWEKDVRKGIPHYAEIEEIAISISNHTSYTGDRGLIVIGGSIHLGVSGQKRDDGNVETTGFEEEDAFEAELREEDSEALRSHSMGNKEKLEDVNFGDEHDHEVDFSRHFSYFAYEGGQGSDRWTHFGTDFHRDLEELKNELIPQVNYRFDAESLDARHYGEFSCREFRESILNNMPHQWNTQSDTMLVLSHFQRHKTGKGSNKMSLGDKQSHKSDSSATGKHSKRVTEVLKKTIDKATANKKSSVVSKDPFAKLPPNAIVAHLKEGIEAIHLYSGRPLCKLLLPKGGLHVDLNGDGVLDHIQATDSSVAEYESDTGHQQFPACFAYATSGIPPLEPLFNGSICRNRMFNFPIGDGLSETDPNYVKVAPPIMLPIPTPTGHHRFRYGKRGYAVFLTNGGVVTAFGSHGNKKWQISSNSRWRPQHESSHNFIPTLKAFPFRIHSLPTAVLVAGIRHSNIISEHGHILASFILPEPPIATMQIVDFNGDGLNDIIMFGQHNIYGYAQLQHPGAISFSVLVLGLIVAMGAVYMTQSTSMPKKRGQSIKRSTDRLD